jgi:hypothetical protein
MLEGVAEKTDALGSLGMHIGIGMGHVSARSYLREAFSAGPAEDAGLDPAVQ